MSPHNCAKICLLYLRCISILPLGCYLSRADHLLGGLNLLSFYVAINYFHRSLINDLVKCEHTAVLHQS